MSGVLYGCQVLLRRAIEDTYRETVASRRVTVVTGPRQSGKTTLVTSQLGAGTLRNLDDAGVLAAADSDPVGSSPRGTRPIVIDEIQRGGEPLVRTIKAVVDRDPRPGQFVLTGSSNFLTEPTIPESLAGRAGFVEVWPFTQGELAGRADRFLDTMLSDPGALSHQPSAVDRREVLNRLCTGGYPSMTTAPGCRPSTSSPPCRPGHAT